MGETNTTEPKKPSFAETIEPLARRYNELIAEDRRWVGGKPGQEELRRKKSEVYDQMINATSRAILEAAKGERKPIINIATDAFSRSASEITVPEFSKRAFSTDALLRAIELAESISSQNPQK